MTPGRVSQAPFLEDPLDPRSCRRYHVKIFVRLRLARLAGDGRYDRHNPPADFGGRRDLCAGPIFRSYGFQSKEACIHSTLCKSEPGDAVSQRR